MEGHRNEKQGQRLREGGREKRKREPGMTETEEGDWISVGNLYVEDQKNVPSLHSNGKIVPFFIKKTL